MYLYVLNTIFEGLQGCKLSFHRSTFFIGSTSYKMYVNQCFHMPIKLQKVVFDSDTYESTRVYVVGLIIP